MTFQDNYNLSYKIAIHFFLNINNYLKISFIFVLKSFLKIRYLSFPKPQEWIEKLKFLLLIKHKM